MWNIKKLFKVKNESIRDKKLKIISALIDKNVKFDFSVDTLWIWEIKKPICICSETLKVIFSSSENRLEYSASPEEIIEYINNYVHK